MRVTPQIILGRLAMLAALGVPLAAAVSCSRPKDVAIPADPKARNEFLDSASTKLGPAERALLSRFASRLETREAGGNSDMSPQITVTRAVELQREYEERVAKAQGSLHEKLVAAKDALSVEVKDIQVVKANPKSAAPDRALRFVVNVSNRGRKTVDRVALRIEVREVSGKYQAAIPSLQLAGPLRPGETGRSTQMLALDRERHQYILEGKPLQVNAVPVQIVYAGGDTVDPGAELKTLENLHRARIE